MMKKNCSFVLLFLMLLGVFACSEKEGGEPIHLELSQSSLAFSVSGGQKGVMVTTNSGSCSVQVPDDASRWCSAAIVQLGGKQTIQVTVSTNDDQVNRKAVLTVVAGTRTEHLTVEQLGTDPQILLAVSSYKTGFLSSVLEVEVVANVEYTAKPGVNWISEMEETGKAMNTEIRKFKILQNDSQESRSGTIVFQQVNGNVKGNVTVTQTGMVAGEGIEDVKSDTLVPVLRAETSSFQPGGEIGLAIDGDMNTMYHSNWNNAGEHYFPITMTFYFDETKAERIDYLVYYPRLTGGNGHIKQVELQVQTAGETGFVKYGDYDFKGSASASRIAFGDGLKQVKAIRLVVKSGAGDGQGFVACAEMQFFKKTTNGNALTAIFTDELCSDLCPGVTAADIDTMSNAFFKNIAALMLIGEYDKDFRIQEYKARQHPDIQAASHKTNPYSLLDNPTGISVKKDEELVVLVGDLHDQTVHLHVQDLETGYGGPSYLLNEGINKITVSRKGLLYILYHTETGSEAPVKIHIASGRVNGYYDVEKHSPSQWRTLLSKAVDPHFDILGKYTHITFPTQKLKSYTPDGDALIRTADEIVRLEHEFMGVYRYGKLFNNRMYMHVVYDDSYMYATAYRTAYQEGTIAELANPDQLRNGSIWGPAHEIGHCNQTRPGFKWIGMTEVTNNVMSQYVQRKMANTSRLQTESMAGDGYVNRYEKAFNTTMAAGIPNGQESDVFCKLVPLWQLYLYITEVLGNTNFYPDVYETIRTEANPATNGECQLNFVRVACRCAQLDLTDFFTAWGYLTPIDTTIDDYGTGTLQITQGMIDELKQEIAAENYPKPVHKFQYITDNTIALYQANQAVVPGKVTVSNGRMTLDGWKNAVAYESYDASGALKAVANGNTVRLFDGKVYAVAANGERTEIAY